MKKKAVRTSRSKEVSISENKLVLTREEILSHPVFQEMSMRIETMGRLLESLPRLVGEAVSSAQRGVPTNISIDIPPGQELKLREMNNVEKEFVRSIERLASKV